MSQENVEIVRRAQPTGVDMVKLFRGSNAPDPATTPDTSGIDLSAFHDDFEVEFISMTAGSLRPVGRGPEALAEAWRDWLEAFESYCVELEEIIDTAGDEVVSLVRIRAQTARDAVAVEHQAAAVWLVREGLIARVHFYLERERALEAVGLPGTE
jgi:ketosteroid isomerase-like protein